MMYFVLAFLIAFGVSYIHYLFRKKRNKTAYAFAFVRFLTILTLLVLLLNPTFEFHDVYTEKPQLIVAVDQSNSIAYLGKSDASIAAVNKFKNSNLEKRFDVYYYAFDKSLNPLDSLTYQVQQTNINASISSIKELHRGAIAPLVIVTDGNQSYGGDYVTAALNYPHEIYPVVVGDTIKKEDVKLVNLQVNRYAYLNNQFPVEISVSYAGTASHKVQLVIKKGSNTVFTKSLTLSNTENVQLIKTNLPANAIGSHRYTVSVEALPSEYNTQNNSRSFGIEVLDESSNIVVVSEIIHPDLGSLKKSIESNIQRKVTFKKPHEVSSLDDVQLVVLYQPQKSFKPVYELLAEKKLNSLTITGTQTDWTFLNTVQASFTKSQSNATQEYGALFNAQFSVFQQEDISFISFPPLEDVFGDITVSRGHQALAFQTINGFETDTPLIAVMEYNTLKEAVVFGEGLWRWRAQSYLNQGSFEPYDGLIGKLIRFTASNQAKQRLVLDYESFYYGLNQVRFTAQYFDKNYESDPNAELQIKLTHKITKESVRLPFVNKQYFYEVDLSNLLSGPYDFTVEVVGQNLKKTGSFEIIPFNIETQFSSADVTKLHQVATNKNKQVYSLDTVEQLISSLENNTNYKPIQKSKKSIKTLIEWHYLLAFLLLLLSIEWFMRKYKGLI